MLQILDCSKPKELADHKFKFGVNGRKFTKKVENIMVTLLRAISPFPTVFSRVLYSRKPLFPDHGRNIFASHKLCYMYIQHLELD